MAFRSFWAERAIRKECTNHEQETLEQSALEYTTFSYVNNAIDEL